MQLTFPDYIVEATGNMTNREEVLPDKLMEKIIEILINNGKVNHL